MIAVVIGELEGLVEIAECFIVPLVAIQSYGDSYNSGYTYWTSDYSHSLKIDSPHLLSHVLL